MPQRTVEHVEGQPDEEWHQREEAPPNCAEERRSGACLGTKTGNTTVAIKEGRPYLIHVCRLTQDIRS
jgi:hypothetical protein